MWLSLTTRLSIKTNETQWALFMSLYLRVLWIQVAQFLRCLYSQKSVYLTICCFTWLAFAFVWFLRYLSVSGLVLKTSKLGRILHSFNIFPVLESSDTEEIVKQHPTQLDSGYFSLHCLTLCSQLPKLSYWWWRCHRNLKCCNSLKGNVPWIQFFSYEVAMFIMIIFKGNKFPLLPHKSKLSLVANGTFAQEN